MASGCGGGKCRTASRLPLPDRPSGHGGASVHADRVLRWFIPGTPPAANNLKFPIAEDMMSARERRKPFTEQDYAALRNGLTPAQLEVLATLEQFRRKLRFVRRPMFQDPIPIVFSPDRSRFIVLESDQREPGLQDSPMKPSRVAAAAGLR